MFSASWKAHGCAALLSELSWFTGDFFRLLSVRATVRALAHIVFVFLPSPATTWFSSFAAPPWSSPFHTRAALCGCSSGNCLAQFVLLLRLPHTRGEALPASVPSIVSLSFFVPHQCFPPPERHSRQITHQDRSFEPA